MDASVIEKLKSSGIDFLKLPEYLKQISGFIPLVKSFFPMVVKYEQTLQLKEGQSVIYSAKVTDDELFLYLFVIEEKDGLIIISDQKFKLTGTEAIDKIQSFIPGAK